MILDPNSKIFFACGANKKAFGQIDQPKGTKPREIRTPGVRRKVELRLQRADRQQTKQEDQEEDQEEDQGREEEKVCCTSSESVDSIYLWKCISHITMMMYHTCMRSFDDVI